MSITYQIKKIYALVIDKNIVFAEVWNFSK